MKKIDFICSINSWLSPLHPPQVGGGQGQLFSFENPKHMKAWDEALTLATFMEIDDTDNFVEDVNTFVEIMDDVAKSQYFDDTEKGNIVNAINIAVETSNMRVLEGAIQKIKDGWKPMLSPPSQKYQEVSQSQTTQIVHSQNTNQSTGSTGSIFTDASSATSQQLSNILRPSSARPKQQANIQKQQAFLSGKKRPVDEMDNLDMGKSSDGSDGSDMEGGFLKTFKSSFFKDSAMPHWHSSASPFNQYATMKRLYRKNFKRFLLKYKMQE